MKSKILAFAAAALIAAHSTAVAAEPSLQLRLGRAGHIKAPPGSATAGSTWVEFPVYVRNSSQHPVWLHGHSLRSPFYRIFTRRSDTATWTSRGLGFCGTGARAQRLAPGASTKFSASVPEDYIGQQIRVELPTYDSPARARATIVSSRATLIK